jgi:hypothetical protein
MQATDTPVWDRVVLDLAAGDGARPDADLVRRLVTGEVPVVVLRGLLPAEAFAENLARLQPLFGTARTTEYVNGSLTTVGPYLAKYLDDPDGYFAAAKEADALLGDVGFDLGERIRAGLRDVLDLRELEPASEPDGRGYAPFVVRIHADGVRNPLHNDNIMRDAAGTGIVLEGLAHQLSCVVCLQECESGGELGIYRRPWEPADERFKIPGGLGYESGVVEGVPGHRFRPAAGDVYLLNPTQYHEIARVSGDTRLTLGFFLGFPDDRLDNALVWG